MSEPANTNKAGLVPDFDGAIDFLDKYQPYNTWAFTAIDPEKQHGPRTKSFGLDQRSDARAFIEKYNGEKHWNVYFHVNQVLRPLTSKARRDDIEAVLSAYIDVDPKAGCDLDAERARILNSLTDGRPADVPSPSVIVDSGGGYQAYWMIKDPLIITDVDRASDCSRVEALSKSLERKFSGDAVADVCRIMRLPGTVNYPNEKKRARGQITRLARVVSADWDLRYDPSDFPIANLQISPKKIAQQRSDFHIVSPEIQELLNKEVPEGERSEHVYRTVMVLAECGLDASDIAGLIMAAPVGKRYKNYKNTLKDVKRILGKCEDQIALINQNHALVIVGGKSVVIRETNDTNSQVKVEFLTVESFCTWFGNKFVNVQDKPKSLGRVWLANADRRQYSGIVFQPGRDTPGYYNLFRGFTVSPKEGDCSKFKAHILNNVCHGNVSDFLWVMGWFAQIFQQPDRKPGTALVIRGPEGTGKTTIGDVIGSLLGQHYLIVSNLRHIVGNFNAHMVACLLLHSEEAFWAGDKQGEGRIKDLITGTHHPIEYKGKDVFMVDNQIRLLITGNPDWMVPASLEARRFAVFEISDEHQQDKPYFAAIAEEMNNGGREALLYELLNFDLSQVDLRTVPLTDALLDQKLESLSIEEAWWVELMQSGRLPRGMDDANACSSKALFEHYQETAQKRGTSRRSIETQIGKFLKRMVPGLQRRVLTYKLYNSREDMHVRDETGSTYEFPPLFECRAAFERLLNQKVEWTGPDEWFDREAKTADASGAAVSSFFGDIRLPTADIIMRDQEAPKPAEELPARRARRIRRR
jgi:hypothetical protein